MAPHDPRNDVLRPVTTGHLAPEPHNADRRNRLRVDVLGQVEAHSVWRLRPLALRELSATGFSLEATGAFEIGAAYKFRIGIEGHRRSIVVQARAMHCTLTSVATDLPIYLAGFALIDPSDSVTREMQSLVRFAESMWAAPDGE